MSEDKTSYYLLTKEHVSVENFDGKEILKVSNEGLTLLAQTAFRDVQFLLRPDHQEQVAGWTSRSFGYMSCRFGYKPWVEKIESLKSEVVCLNLFLKLLITENSKASYIGP